MAAPLVPLLVVSLLSTAVQVGQQAQAQKQARRANQLQERIADIKAQRERRRQVAQVQKIRAQNLTQAEASGTTGSSSVAGATASAQTQAASNIGFLNQTREIGAGIASTRDKIAASQFRAGVAGTIGSAAASEFQRRGGFTELFDPTDTGV